jgi:hypothetical protein
MRVWPNDNQPENTSYPRQTVGDFLSAAKEIGVEFLARPVQDGDLYLASRNTGIKLLTARKVDHGNGWVVPVEPAYVYDIHECQAVVEI